MHANIRSSHAEVLCEKVALKNFAKFTEKHLCQSLRCRPQATLLRKKLWYRCFPMSLRNI